MLQSSRPVAEGSFAGPQPKPTTPQQPATATPIAPAAAAGTATVAQPPANPSLAAKAMAWMAEDLKLVKGAFAAPDPDNPAPKPLTFKDGNFTHTSQQSDTNDQGA